jgi:kumamolisin
MSDRKVFENSVIPLPDEPSLAPQGLLVNAKTAENNDQLMTLLFSLAPPEGAMAELEAKVARGEVVPAEELQKTYTSKPADVKKLKAWLKAEGYKIVQVSPDNTSIYAQATVEKIEESLGVNMVRVTRDGVTYTAAQNAPSMPEEVGDGVHAIIGLQPFRQAHKHSRRFVPPYGNRVSTLSAAAAGPSTNIQNAPPYLVSELLKAYHANGLGVTGKGQTIAILIDTFPKKSDLTKFWQQNHVSTTLARVQMINVKGGALPTAEGEETLDVEWSSGIAPDAKIRVYASGSLTFVDLDRALDRIIADLPSQPGMRQLSISLGLGETFMSPGEVATQHQKFLRLAAGGVNVFVSSGDAGSNPSVSGHSSNGPLQAEYESSDSSVIGVGGTRLTLSLNGSVSSETAWTGSGGGTSIFFARPVWQTGAGVPAGTKRVVPDVSLAADPNKGAFLVFQGQVSQIGGTSWSAPVWAGFCALMNEARSKAQKPLLPFLNPLIYPLMNTPAFRDIKSGNNGAFQAGPGYDMVTGVGVPNVKKLIAALTH